MFVLFYQHISNPLIQSRFIPSCLCHTPVPIFLSLYSSTKDSNITAILRVQTVTLRGYWNVLFGIRDTLFSCLCLQQRNNTCFHFRLKKKIAFLWNNYQFSVWFSFKCHEEETCRDKHRNMYALKRRGFWVLCFFSRVSVFCISSKG